MEKTNITRGEIYMASLPIISNTSIQSGVRPVLVVSNEECNRHSPVIHIVPITSKGNKHSLPTHIAISTDNGLKLDSLALCEQSMLVQRDVLFKKIGELDKKTLNKINIAILLQFGLLQLPFLNKLVSAIQNKRESGVKCA